VPEITIDVRTDVWLRLRNHAERDGVAVDTLVNDLLADALTAGLGESTFIGAGESTMSDLGRHAKRYLREGLA
jgi:hypothetical protein